MNKTTQKNPDQTENLVQDTANTVRLEHHKTPLINSIFCAVTAHDAPNAARRNCVKVPVTDRLLFIGDTHLPAEHRDYLAFICAVRDKYRTTTTLHVGDLYDFQALSYHESDPDLPGSGDEHAMMKARAQDWAAEFPELAICRGNHDMMPLRKAKTHGLPKAMLKGYNEMFDTPKTWRWSPNTVEFKLKCGMPCVMQHEVATSLSAGKNKLRTASLIQGHSHQTAGVEWATAPQWRLFFMSVGCGVDPEHPAMAYAKAGVLRAPCLGCGVIIEGLAMHIPMWTNKRGRWTGKLP